MSDKIVEKVMVVVCEYNYYLNVVVVGFCVGCICFIGFVIFDLENISYICIVNYFECQVW